MKISDEAVEAALAAYLADNAAGAEREDAMRAALAAADPYLMPDREALWDAIAKVRDAYPRLSNDAPTDEIIDVVFALLGSEVPSDQPCLGDGVCTNPKCPVHGIKEEPSDSR